MSDYTEHLISMAGGDGDTVDQLAPIEARSAAAMDYPGAVTIEQSQADVPALLALARKQAAQIERVLDLASTRSRCGWQISADEIRKALAS